MIVLGQLDVAEVSSQSGRLKSQPALPQPRLQLLAVMEELKQPQLSLQLSPPEETRRWVHAGAKFFLNKLLIKSEAEEYLLLLSDTRDLY